VDRARPVNDQWKVSAAPGEYYLTVGASYGAGDFSNAFKISILSSSSVTTTSTGAAYLVNATFVSRFCSNSSAIPASGASTSSSQASSLQFTGNLEIGFSKVIAGIQNSGSSPVPVEAICIDAAGVVPGNTTASPGPTATTIQFAISPNGPIQPGQQANVSATFTGGSGVYYMPQGGMGITLIASDSSSMSQTEPQGLGFTTTGESPVRIVSIRSTSLISGNPPVLSATLAFNSSNPIYGVDIFVNGTYVGTVGVSANVAAPGPPGQYDVSYQIGIIEPGRVSILAGARYTITFAAIAVFHYSQETSVSTTVVAG
jgi:hypothetical protein